MIFCILSAVVTGFLNSTEWLIYGRGEVVRLESDGKDFCKDFEITIQLVYLTRAMIVVAFQNNDYHSIFPGGIRRFLLGDGIVVFKKSRTFSSSPGIILPQT